MSIDLHLGQQLPERVPVRVRGGVRGRDVRRGRERVRVGPVPSRRRVSGPAERLRVSVHHRLHRSVLWSRSLCREAGVEV